MSILGSLNLWLKQPGGSNPSRGGLNLFSINKIPTPTLILEWVEIAWSKEVCGAVVKMRKYFILLSSEDQTVS